MRCVICNSPNVEMRRVEEEIRWGSNILLAPMELLVCLSCGDRYYDKKALKKIEEMRDRLQKHDLDIEEIGKVFKEHAA